MKLQKKQLMENIKKVGAISEAEQKKQRECMSAVKEKNDNFLRLNGFRPKAFVMTLGCQQNEADSEKLAGMAEAMGYEMSDTPDNAYLIMVNTCAIREHAEKRALSIVGQYKHLKAKNPGFYPGFFYICSVFS